MRRRVLHNINNVQIKFTYVGEIATGITNSPRGVYVTPDGSKVFVMMYSSSNIYVYDMSTSNDITTATHDGIYAFGINNCYGMHFSTDGLNVFSNSLNSGRIYRCSLSTPFDLTTKGSVQTSPDYPNYSYYYNLETNPDGSKIYANIVSSGYNKINRYDMSISNDVTTTSFVEAYDVRSYWFRFIDSGNYILTGQDTYLSLFKLKTPYSLGSRVLIKKVVAPIPLYYANINGMNIYAIVDPNGTKMLRQYSLEITGI